MKPAPDMDELQARFSDQENTYKDLLAVANTTIANLNVLLKATQRELQKTLTESLEIKKKLDAQSAEDAIDARATERHHNVNGNNGVKTDAHEAM